jgi:hypothetical protein
MVHRLIHGPNETNQHETTKDPTLQGSPTQICTGAKPPMVAAVCGTEPIENDCEDSQRVRIMGVLP